LPFDNKTLDSEQQSVPFHKINEAGGGHGGKNNIIKLIIKDLLAQHNLLSP
jgi:hypothetical protein